MDMAYTYIYVCVCVSACLTVRKKMRWIKKGVKDKKETLLGIHTNCHKGVGLAVR